MGDGTSTLTGSTTSRKVPVMENERSSMADMHPCSYPTVTPIVFSHPPIPQAQKSGFEYLESARDYALSRPEFPISSLQNAFGNLYVRYDFALQVRLKVDEKLREFKSVLNVHPNLSMRLCFKKWDDEMKGPVYTISRTKTLRRNIKSILVKADDFPRHLWPAQRFIREVLDACHLFIEQYEFLQQLINEWLNDIEGQISNLEQSLEASSLRSVDRRHILNRVPVMRNEYLQTLDWIKKFYEQIAILLDEIQESLENK